MDPKSGVFTAIVPGCYLFCLTLCSQDMKKVLVALRKNGEEVLNYIELFRIHRKKDMSTAYYGIFRLGQSTTKTTTTTTGTVWPARVSSLNWRKGIEFRSLMQIFFLLIFFSAY